MDLYKKNIIPYNMYIFKFVCIPTLGFEPYTIYITSLSMGYKGIAKTMNFIMKQINKRKTKTNNCNVRKRTRNQIIYAGTDFKKERMNQSSKIYL